MAAYGIDLGTTYSAIAKMGVTGVPEIIPDAETARDTLASAVIIREDGSFSVGDEVKEEGIECPERLLQFFKRWIGRDEDPNREIYQVDGKEYNPVELSRFVLERIVEYAKASGEDVKDVVITCPAYFNNSQRDATRKAGELAGLNVLSIINEPTAAALNYCYNRFNEDQSVLVYDLGGGTFDVTLMKMSERDGQRNVNVLGTNGDAFLGGCDWDKKLYELFLNKYEEKYGVSPDDMSDDLKQQIRASVEGHKMALSRKDKTKTKIPYEGEIVALEVTLEEFEAATQDLVDQTVGWLNKVLEDAGYTDDMVDVLLLVGGSTKMPMIKTLMQNRFGDKVQFGDPDKAVAKGAAIVAQQLQDQGINDFIRMLQEQVEKGGKITISNDGKATVEHADGNLEVIDMPDIPAGLSEQFAPTDGPIEITGDNIEEIVTVAPPANPGTTIVITDVAARTFGVIVGSYRDDGSIEFVVDNIVRMGEETPCEYQRTYYTPVANAKRLRFPIVESESPNESDVINRSDDGVFTFPDASLGMIERTSLFLPIPVDLPEASPIDVTFSLDHLGNVHMTATEPSSGTTEAIDYNFSSISDEKMEEFKNNRKDMKLTLID